MNHWIDYPYSKSSLLLIVPNVFISFSFMFHSQPFGRFISRSDNSVNIKIITYWCQTVSCSGLLRISFDIIARNDSGVIWCIWYKDPIAFNCTDSFWPLTYKKIQIGAHASVQIKTIIPLDYKFMKDARSCTYDS